MNDELMKYFKGDSLAAGVWLGKYALPGEVTPDDMHRRMAKEEISKRENLPRLQVRLRIRRERLKQG